MSIASRRLRRPLGPTSEMNEIPVPSGNHWGR